MAREQSLQVALEDSSLRLYAWLAAEQSSPSRKLESQERAIRLADSLGALPENQREAIILRHWHHCSLAEIAGRLGCTTAGGEDSPAAA